ncbi:MAG: zinc-ribbon domain-containing protein [Chloroflexota bacterium]
MTDTAWDIVNVAVIVSCCFILVVVVAIVIAIVVRRKRQPRSEATSERKPVMTPVQPTQRQCPVCGASNPPENNFCEQCGASLSQ